MQDRTVEAHGLDFFGSYGKQLGCVIESISVLVSHLDRKDLAPAEEHAVYEFRELARNAREAVSEFRGKAAHEDATLAAMDKWVGAIAAAANIHFCRLCSPFPSDQGCFAAVGVH